MSIICEAYLFEVTAFAEAVAPYVAALDKDEDYGRQLLGAAVVDLYEHNPSAERLSGDFGGNDLNTLRQDVAEDDFTIGWMLAMFQCGYFESVKSYFIDGSDSPEWKPTARPRLSADRTLLEYGRRVLAMLLGDSFYRKPLRIRPTGTMMLRFFLQNIGWNADDTILLAMGRDFVEFARKYVYAGSETQDIPDYWNKLKHMTAYYQRWLDLSDVARLAPMLIEAEPKLIRANAPRIADFDMERAMKAYHLFKNAYLAAQEAGCGLCIIRS